MSAYREGLLAAAKGLSESLCRAEIAGMNLPYYVDVEWQRLKDAILALAEQQPAKPALPGPDSVSVSREILRKWAKDMRGRGIEVHGVENRLPSFIVDSTADEMDAMLAAGRAKC